MARETGIDPEKMKKFQQGVAQIFSGLSRAAEAGLMTTVKAASANRVCLDEIACSMFEDEEDGDWRTLKKAERRVWVMRASAALQGFGKFLSGKSTAAKDG